MTQGTTSAADDPRREIQIAAASGATYAVGGSIPLSISYRNSSSETLSFSEPARTWEVRLAARHGTASPREVPFGRIFYYKTENYERTTVEDAEEVILEPGARFDFDYDVGARWPELFEPGVHVLQIHDLSDDDEELHSNEVEIQVLFADSSVPELLTILGDEEASADSKLFAARWVGAVVPDFHLALPDPDEEKQRENTAKIEEAGRWWQEHAADPSTRERIAAINP